MSQSHLSLDSLARITALDYKVAPSTYEQPEDLYGLSDDPAHISVLGVKYYPSTVETSAYDVMDRQGLDLSDFKLQRSIAKIAIKYIDSYEEMKQKRQTEADRLNNPVH